MVRRLGLGEKQHLTYASLALNPRYVHCFQLSFLLGSIDLFFNWYKHHMVVVKRLSLPFLYDDLGILKLTTTDRPNIYFFYCRSGGWGLGSHKTSLSTPLHLPPLPPPPPHTHSHTTPVMHYWPFQGRTFFVVLCFFIVMQCFTL